MHLETRGRIGTSGRNYKMMEPEKNNTNTAHYTTVQYIVIRVDQSRPGWNYRSKNVPYDLGSRSEN